MNKLNFLLNRISAWHILVIIAVYMLVYNYCLPLLADDYTYANVFHNGFIGTLQSSRLTSLHEIFISMHNHYFTWGGRVVAHSLVQFFIWQGKYVFDIVNALMFILSILAIYWLAVGKIAGRNLNKKYIIWIFICLWLASPSFFVANIWLTGACNYRWMSLVQLLFLFPYMQAYIYNKQQWPQKFLLYVFPLFSLIMGAGNENSSLITIAIAIILTVLLKRQQQAKKWMVISIITAIAGWLLLILAPGNFARAALMADAHQIHWGANVKIFLLCLVLMLPIYLVTIYCGVKAKKGCQQSKMLIASAVLAVMALLNIVMMVFVPAFPPRAGIASINLICVASLLTWQNYVPDKRKLLKYGQKLGWAVLIVLTIVSLAGTLLQVKDIPQQTRMRRMEIADKVGQDAALPQYQINPRWTNLSLQKGILQVAIDFFDITPDAGYYYNQNFARYYHLKSVRGIKK